jgi:hypothetical protein
MSDYDSVGDQWVPYLMRFDTPLRKFSSVSTDEWGFRNSVSQDGNIVKISNLENTKTGIIVGSSTVFGVGSSADRFTIPSSLNRVSETTWLNFGGRAFNSTQELILFLLHLPNRIDQLVLFSGVNNITLAFLSPSTSPIYNSFFYQSVFERAMQNPPDDYIGVRRSFGRLMNEVKHRFKLDSRKSAKLDIKDSYQNVLHCFKRDLRAFKILADGLGIQLHFALQPLATWIEKQLSSEEKEIFSILDSMSMDWQVLSQQIKSVRDDYFFDVERICDELLIDYCNVNLAPDFLTDEWLFVDRVHLTDRGCEVAAKILKREFNL